MINKLRFSNVLLIILLLTNYINVGAICSLPVAMLGITESNQYGLVLNSSYTNCLDYSSALGLALDFGEKEFRLTGNWVKNIFNQHQLQMTADYLSQRNEYDYLSGTNLVWNRQYVLDVGYAYLFAHHKLNCFNTSCYYLKSSESELPIIYQFGDNVAILYRLIKGGRASGVGMGLAFNPGLAKMGASIYYDAIHYRNAIESVSDRKGIGGNFVLEQILFDEIGLKLTLTKRPLFDEYGGKISWLIPTRTCRQWELSVGSQYVTGALPEPHDWRTTVALSYYWHNYEAENVDRASIALSQAARAPLLKMPQTLNVSKQIIVN